MLNWFQFFTYVFIICFTPGPNNVIAMSTSTKFGLKNAVKFNIGAAIGFGIIVSIFSLTNILLKDQIYKYYSLISIIGGSYIIYLAFVMFNNEEDDKIYDNKDTKLRSLISGFILQFVNPKGLIAGCILASSFIMPNISSNFQITWFILFLIFMAFISGFSWSLFGVVLRNFIIDYKRLVDVVLAIALIYCGFMIFETRF